MAESHHGGSGAACPPAYGGKEGHSCPKRPCDGAAEARRVVFEATAAAVTTAAAARARVHGPVGGGGRRAAERPPHRRGHHRRHAHTTSEAVVSHERRGRPSPPAGNTRRGAMRRPTGPPESETPALSSTLSQRVDEISCHVPRDLQPGRTILLRDLFAFRERSKMGTQILPAPFSRRSSHPSGHTVSGDTSHNDPSEVS